MAKLAPQQLAKRRLAAHERYMAQYTPEEHAQRAALLEKLEAVIERGGYTRKDQHITAEQRLAKLRADAELQAEIDACPKPQPVFVYFVRATESGRIKIGKARDVERRLAGIRTGCSEPLELMGWVDGGVHREDAVHSMFRADREHGEWFRPSAALLAFIREHATNG